MTKPTSHTTYDVKPGAACTCNDLLRQLEEYGKCFDSSCEMHEWHFVNLSERARRLEATLEALVIYQEMAAAGEPVHENIVKFAWDRAKYLVDRADPTPTEQAGQQQAPKQEEP